VLGRHLAGVAVFVSRLRVHIGDFLECASLFRRPAYLLLERRNGIVPIGVEGVKKQGECKFTMTVDDVVLLDVVEIQKCTSMTEESLKGVKVWKI